MEYQLVLMGLITFILGCVWFVMSFAEPDTINRKIILVTFMVTIVILSTKLVSTIQ